MTKQARVLIFDIEVASQPEVIEMCKKYGLNEWRLSWKIDASTHYITHISYGWEGEKKAYDLSLLDYKGSLKGDANERKLLEDFIKVYNTADQTVAHYGSKFDLNFLNSRIAMYGLPPLRPVKMTDTWRILKNKFAMLRNTLEAAIEFFKCPYGKPHLEKEIWRRVTMGDRAAHKILRNRCHYDVLSLRWIYETKLRPYDTTKSNRALAHRKLDIDDTEISVQLQTAICPECEQAGTLRRKGYTYMKVNTSVQLVCVECRSWSYAPLLKFRPSKNSPVRYRIGVPR